MTDSSRAVRYFVKKKNMIAKLEFGDIVLAIVPHIATVRIPNSIEEQFALLCCCKILRRIYSV